MRPAGSPDVFIVLNGPQDGNEFPVGAPKIQIGQDNSCMVNLQLDQNVRPIHAIAMATGKGYSIRASTDSHVTVDGKRAGRFKSRLIRPGKIMRVGYTDLMLECSPDGMAGRSQGIVLQNDFVWALTKLLKCVVDLVEKLGRLILTLPRYAWRHKILTIVVLVVASRYVPGLDNIFGQLFGTVKGLIAGALRN